MFLDDNGIQEILEERERYASSVIIYKLIPTLWNHKLKKDKGHRVCKG